MASPLYGLLLTTKGEVRRIRLKDQADKSALTKETLQTILKKKTAVEELHVFKFGQLSLTLFGYKSGKAGTENQHQLPPPLDSMQLYSDILLIASKASSSWQVPCPFTPEQYEQFYQKAFGGFDEDEEEEDDDEEEDELEDEVEQEEEEEKEKEEEKEELEEDEENEEEDEDEENEEDEEQVDGEGELGEEAPKAKVPKPIVKRAQKKKSTQQTTKQSNWSSQQTLMNNSGLIELEALLPLSDCSDSVETEIRSNSLSVFTKLLGSMLTSHQLEALEFATLQMAFESAKKRQVICHFKNPLFVTCYQMASRTLLSNLDPCCYVENTGLLSKILQGDLTFNHLASMSTMDMAPHLYTELHERQILREKQQLEGNKAMATDMFKCGRCQKRECTFYELQTRSADEPMTKFITCLNCGNHWRM